MAQKFVVTGINRLTGLRDRISNPLPEDIAIRKKKGDAGLSSPWPSL